MSRGVFALDVSLRQVIILVTSPSDENGGSLIFYAHDCPGRKVFLDACVISVCYAWQLQS